MNYTFLDSYKIPSGLLEVERAKSIGRLRHYFFALPEIQIQEALTTFNPFPEELKKFYPEIGFGFMHRNKGETNTILDPLSLIGPASKSMIRAHAHHIVFKKGTKAMAKYLKDSRKILRKYGIDPLKGVENLVWTPNKNHTIKAAKAVRDALRKADKIGTKEAVVNTLKELGEHFANNTIKTLY